MSKTVGNGLGIILASTLLLTSCNGSRFGQLCSYPEKSYPSGNWKSVAFLEVRKRWFMGWMYKKVFSVRVRSKDGLHEFEETVVLSGNDEIDFECEWRFPSSVFVKVSGDLDLSLEITQAEGSWASVMREKFE